MPSTPAPQYAGRVKRVAIIGAGVAGLQAARALQKCGVGFTVFEAYDDVGGVWRANYMDYRLQVVTPVYEFPEFPYPTEYNLSETELPDGQVVYDYCCAYAEKFGLREHIRFGKRLTKIEPLDSTGRNLGWWVYFADENSHGEEKREVFHFVIVATGVNAIPAMPEDYKDLEAYRGVLLPARYADDPKLVQNKKVLIIGGNKTAMALAETCQDLGADTTVLFRRAHWPIPEYTWGIVPVHLLMFRLCKIALPGYYTHRGFMRFWHRVLLHPLKQAIWAVLRSGFQTTLGLFGDLVPEISPVEDIYISGTYISSRRLFDLMRKGRITVVKGDVDRFTEDGVILRDGQHLAGFDVILTALGYYRDYSFLPPAQHQLLDLEEDGLWLYRHVIPPRIPCLAFVGGEIVTNDGILSLGLQAEWIARVITGRIPLPPVEDQEADVAATKEWKRSWMLPSTRRSQMMMTHESYYRDQLVKDAGYSIYMHGWRFFNWFTEYLLGPLPAAYAKFFRASEEETLGKRRVPRTKFRTARPIREQLPQPLKIELRSGGRPVSDLMRSGIVDHPLTATGMPVLRTVRGVKYGSALRKAASGLPDDNGHVMKGNAYRLPVQEE